MNKNWIFEKALEHNEGVVPHTDLPPLKIVFSGDGTICDYYRIISPAIEMVKAKLIKPIYLEDLKNQEDKLMAMVMADILVLERPWDAEWLTIIPPLKFGGVGIIIETDDWIEGVKTANLGKVNAYWNEEKVQNFRDICNLADVIITSTKDMALKYEATGIKTFFAPNHIELDPRWDIPIESNKNIIVLFSGPTHADDLDILRDPLFHILEQHPDVTLRVLGFPPHWITEFFRKFSEQIRIDTTWHDVFDYPRVLAESGDILLIPLIDNEFNQIGKSDIKFLEATMTGKACIASNVGIYRQTIKHNKNGFLASTTEDWIHYLELLIANEKLKVRLHSNALQYIFSERLYHKNLNQWYSAYIYVLGKSLARKKVAMEIERAKQNRRIIIPKQGLFTRNYS